MCNDSKHRVIKIKLISVFNSLLCQCSIFWYRDSINTRVLIPVVSHKRFCQVMPRHTQCTVNSCRTSPVGRNPSESPASTRTQWRDVCNCATLVTSHISCLEHGVRWVEEFHFAFNFGLFHKLGVIASEFFVRSAASVELRNTKMERMSQDSKQLHCG